MYEGVAAVGHYRPGSAAWITALRPHPERVVTTKNGGDLHPKNYRNNLLANSWNRLIGRVREDIPEFPAYRLQQAAEDGH